MSPTFSHQQLVVRRGARSDLTLAIAIHSTVLGPAIGGCRMRHYAGWRAGVADALRLSAAMTDKCATAGLAHGGGKSVIVTPATLPPGHRRAALLDLGDLIESLDGRYSAGPDVGTGPVDMVTIAERTGHVLCRPVEHGGSGDSSAPTARGVHRAIEAVCARRFGSADLTGRRITILGLGAVGRRLAEALAAAGAELTVADIDPAGLSMAGRWAARWLPPAEALLAPADVLVPAAVGGLITAANVPFLRCSAIAGPANNQLAAESVADLLHARGIVWVPDYVAGAGGVIHASARERSGLSEAAALARVDAIGSTVADLLAADVAPHRAARSRNDARLHAAAGMRS